MFVDTGMAPLKSISDGTLPYFSSKDGRRGNAGSGRWMEEGLFPAKVGRLLL